MNLGERVGARAGVNPKSGFDKARAGTKPRPVAAHRAESATEPRLMFPGGGVSAGGKLPQALSPPSLPSRAPAPAVSLSQALERKR